MIEEIIAPYDQPKVYEHEFLCEHCRSLVKLSKMTRLELSKKWTHCSQCLKVMTEKEIELWCVLAYIAQRED